MEATGMKATDIKVGIEAGVARGCACSIYELPTLHSPRTLNRMTPFRPSGWPPASRPLCRLNLRHHCPPTYPRVYSKHSNGQPPS